ncbi:AI-2E family transporter [Methanolobus bombayensis]|uniref:AI-2E family transporter n=1 Tax=Methanolobus bombayensis TaxID=38023 RepID=UPI001AEB30B7|nr:AI-2E family transporter [Methanolobus bombayensis]MBP1908693.1 putative PurR-regulated permease PerM [Methanolobus bombayensis]
MNNSSKMPQALLILTILAAALAYALYPYINAFFGAFILYVVFKPLYKYLVRKRLNKSVAAFTIIILTIILVLIPLYLLMTIIIIQIQSVLFSTDTLLAQMTNINTYIDQLNLVSLPFEINLQEKVTEVVTAAANYFSVLLINAVQSIGQRMIEFVIMYFLLYYLLLSTGTKYSDKLTNAIPFSRRNTKILLDEFSRIVNSTLISSGIIAIIQGGLLTITFLLLGVEGAFLWGFIAIILSFLPVVGATLIWIPAVIIQIVQQDYFTAAGILIGGIILSSIDNVLRPIIQNKVGRIHPLESLIGVIIGLNLFGLLGIIIGPLLISYVVLMAKMFNDEYLSENETKYDRL